MQGDRPLNLPMQDLIVYEAHVRGFTADPASGVDAPGTFLGMADRLDYLQVRPRSLQTVPAPHASRAWWSCLPQPRLPAVRPQCTTARAGRVFTGRAVMRMVV